MKPTWYLFKDGTIGVLLMDGDRPAIASGEPGNYTAYDYDLTPLENSVKVGLVSKYPTFLDAVKMIREMNSIASVAAGSIVQHDRLINKMRRTYKITGLFLENLKPKHTRGMRPGNKFRFPDRGEVYRFVGIQFLATNPVIFFEDEAGKLHRRYGFHLSELIKI